MKTFITSVPFNGKKLTFHRISGNVSVDITNSRIGTHLMSWIDKDAAASGKRPDKISFIELTDLKTFDVVTLLEKHVEKNIVAIIYPKPLTDKK